MSEEYSTPSSRPYQNFRSQASSNWRVKDDSPRVQQPQSRGPRSTNRANEAGAATSAPGGDEAPVARLYVGNLLYTAQKADIEKIFQDNGFTVAGVSISTDSFTGRNPSYCFVDMESEDDAQRAIAQLNGLEVLGRALKVSPGVARRSGQGQGPGGSGREARMKNFDGGWGERSREERSAEYKPSFDRWNRSDAHSHWTAPQTEGRRLYFGSLPRIEPQSALDEEIQLLFATYLPAEHIKPSAVSKLISPHPSKITGDRGNYYYCFVDLDKADDVDMVVAKLDGKEGSWGGTLRVSRAREQRDRTGEGRKVVREHGLGSETERRNPGNWRRDEPQD